MKTILLCLPLLYHPNKLRCCITRFLENCKIPIDGGGVQTPSRNLPDDIPAGTIPPEYPIESEIKVKGDVATLLVYGSLPTITILVNQNMDQASFNSVFDELGNTIGEHELEHVRLWVQYWNALRIQLSGLDGDYCPANCATIAVEAALEIRDIFHAEAQIQNTSFDLIAYPKLIAKTKGERERLNKVILDQDNIVIGAKANLSKLGKKWEDSKCQKIK